MRPFPNCPIFGTSVKAKKYVEKEHDCKYEPKFICKEKIRKYQSLHRRYHLTHNALERLQGVDVLFKLGLRSRSLR